MAKRIFEKLLRIAVVGFFAWLLARPIPVTSPVHGHEWISWLSFVLIVAAFAAAEWADNKLAAERAALIAAMAKPVPVSPVVALRKPAEKPATGRKAPKGKPLALPA